MRMYDGEILYAKVPLRTCSAATRSQTSSQICHHSKLQASIVHHGPAPDKFMMPNIPAPAMAARLRPMRRSPRWHSRPCPPPLHRSTVPHCRFASSQRENTNHENIDAGDRPFQTQLWDSTYQRVQREREERKKFGAMQNFGEGTAGSALTWLACKQSMNCLRR